MTGAHRRLLCRRRPRSRDPCPAGQRGQATVEFALLLPVVMLLLLAVLQVAVVVRAQVLVTHAAREAARAVAVDERSGAALDGARSSGALDPARLRVLVGPRGRPGGRVQVQLRYRAPTDVALIGALLDDVELGADATMRVER